MYNGLIIGIEPLDLINDGLADGQRVGGGEIDDDVKSYDLFRRVRHRQDLLQ